MWEPADPPGPPVFVDYAVGDPLAVQLLSARARGDESRRLEVEVHLAEPDWEDEAMETLAFDSETGEHWVNGMAATLDDVREANRKLEGRLARIAEARRLQRAAWLRELAAAERWRLTEDEIQAHAERHGPVKVEMRLDEVEDFVARHRGTVDALDVEQEAIEDLAQAMPATSMNPGLISTVNGAGIGIYMTEPGCPPSSYLTNYTRLAGSDTDHSRNVSAILAGVAPGAYVYCRAPNLLPTDSQLSGSGGNPPVRIISVSASEGTTTTYQVSDRLWDDYIYNKAISVVKSAGNFISGTDYVRSPGKGPNVITVGNYIDSTNAINADPVEGSNYKDPTDVKFDKPELSAPGTNITAGTNSSGGSLTYTGTSQATPHVAAGGAAVMEFVPGLELRPAWFKSFLMGIANDPISGGFNKVGFGGIDFMSVTAGWYGKFWGGTNSEWSTFDQEDGHPSDGLVVHVPMNAALSKVHVFIAWTTRGSHTYSNRNNHPETIGIDLDLFVYAPGSSGSWTLVGSSESHTNGHEHVQFDPAVTASHRIRITRKSNRDTSNNLRIGLAVMKVN